MLKLRRLIQLLDSGLSHRQISRELKMGRNCVSGYAGHIASSGLSLGELLQQDDSKLFSMFFKGPGASENTDNRYPVLGKLLPYYSGELRKTGVTKLLLWEEYRKAHPDGYGYTQFKVYLNKHIHNTTYSYHANHLPGDEAQVDFAGTPLHICSSTGDVHQCPVLVGTLVHSGLTFMIALHDACQESFYYGMSAMIRYFGGVPQSIKSDNMGQWVKRSDRYEPTFNDAMIQWALHYNTALTAARVKKPRDKAHIEAHVNIAYRRVYARLRNRTFYSLAELNHCILEHLHEHNHMPMQGKDYSRRERFVSHEQPLLRPLPLEDFVFRYRKEFTVNQTYHVQISSDRHFYSIPYRYVGMGAVMIYDYEHVEVYVVPLRKPANIRFSFSYC